ncbi:MAG: tripartite tricarboxylate transporter substrate binding protein [Betaproteobacteria bacterium]|nr:tripartite tricarboxylate transporter substrate binding protein [Betaproteobacteria bacterium]
MRTIHRLLCISAAPLFLAVAASAVAQQSYPSRAIRFVVPFPPGGSSDFLARLVSQKLSERLGQQLVLDHRAGAGGALATNLVAKSPPDGYTLLLGFVGPLAISPHLEKVLYDPVRDFSAASMLGSSYHVLAIHPSLPVRAVKELISLAKKRPGELNYASAGSGTTLYLVTELFKTRAGINIVHIPYKGAGPAAIAVISGESQMLFGSVPSVMPHVRARRLAALAITRANRSPLLPEVPTLVESGLRGVDVGSWFALVTPAGTPSDIMARLNAEVIQISAALDYRQQLERQGVEPITSSSEQFPAFLKAEFEKWGKVIKTAGVKSD